MSEKADKFNEATERVKELIEENKNPPPPPNPPPNPDSGRPDPQRGYDGR